MSAQPVVMSSEVQPGAFRPVPACDVTFVGTRIGLAVEPTASASSVAAA